MSTSEYEVCTEDFRDNFFFLEVESFGIFIPSGEKPKRFQKAYDDSK